MFYDQAKINVKGGDGGNGVVAFRREKYVPEGGPNGGDGGRGGNVIITTDSGLKTLLDFKYKKHYRADRGQHGQGKGRHGKGADDMILKVPLGTVIKDGDTGNVIADLKDENQEVVIVEGGRGGRGNARFVSAKNRVPTLAEKGEPGQEKWLILELKLLADVGLIGYPNAGKSTLISRVSAAKPKIADYPFTTLTPNLGVVASQGDTFIMADIPGLIEGAHTGAGLGHEFLRHVERTKVLLHLVDAAGTEGRDPVQDIETINRELEKYDSRLSKRPQIIVANKIDLPDTEEKIAKIKERYGNTYPIFSISAVSGQSVEELIEFTSKTLETAELEEPDFEEQEVKSTVHKPKERFNISRDGEIWVITGEEIEKHLAMTDFENEAAVRRFQNIVKAMGIEKELRESGAKEGDTVRIDDLEFDLMD
ncbi:GTP-binding protein [Desulfitispora alkaliphila]|uniref:GTPase ObgE n=1 Tax=Desulfitispora alkaliphila TaxID=622674 RepID=UPI003D232B28